MKVEHPNAIGRFREKTGEAARTFSMTLNRRRCARCGEYLAIEGGKITKGYKASIFVCKECK